MPDNAPIRFSNRELARSIASQQGSEPQTVKVTMIGREDVSKLLRKIRAAQAVPPSTVFRAK